MKRLMLLLLPILLLFAACRSAGSTQTQSVDLPYPAADPVTLNLDTSAGDITVSAADTSGISGTLATNVGSWEAQTTTSGGTITIQQGRASADVIPDATNTWDLQVGRGTALILNNTNTAANTTLNLGGLPLSAVNTTATTGNYTINYGTPHPADDGGTAAFQLTNGSLSATGLANSHLNDLSVTTTGGSIQLTFDGEPLTMNMNVRVETRAGDVLLKVPANIPAQITYRTSSGTVLETDPQYQKLNNITFAVGADAVNTAPHLIIEIRTVVGDLRLAGG